jgi:hypothetical protein
VRCERRAVRRSEGTSPLFGMALRRRSQRVVPFSWSSPFPNAGQWLGSTPAGCEVCRKPAETRAPPWITVSPYQLLTETPSCEAGHMEETDQNVSPPPDPRPRGLSTYGHYQVSVLKIRRYRRQHLRLIFRLAELPIRRNCRRCAQERHPGQLINAGGLGDCTRGLRCQKIEPVRTQVRADVLE